MDILTGLALASLLRIAGMLPSGVKQRIRQSGTLSRLVRVLYNAFDTTDSSARLVVAGPLKGMRIVMGTQDHMAFLTDAYEPQVVKALIEHCKPGMVACDIGAHLGYFTLLLSRLVQPGGYVYAFEPFTENYRRLEKTIRINRLSNVLIRPLAVSNKCGNAYFRESLSSCMGRIVWGHNGTYDGVHQPLCVHTVSLDEFADRERLKKIDLIKMDIEGEELNALLGMQRLLTNGRPTIVCEVHAGLVERSEVISFLEGLEYRVYSLEGNMLPVNRFHFEGGHILAKWEYGGRAEK